VKRILAKGIRMCGKTGAVGAMAAPATPDDENGRLGLAKAKRGLKATLHGSANFGVGLQSVT
jgi:hypothetical protein